MAVESLTYAALGERLGCSPEAARALAKRLRLPRQKANDGKALVVVDLTEIEHKPLPARSPTGTLSVVETLQTSIATLVEAAAAGHRADFERERDRADKLLSEMLRATVDLIAAKEATARTEGDLAVVRAQAEGEIAAVREHAERLETELAGMRARRRWWWHRATA